MSFRSYILLLILIAAFACSNPEAEELDLPEQVSFNFDIRPILSDNCYVCHGPDSSSRQAGLRLDLRSFATSRLEGGNRAIVPGSSRKSELIQRVSSEDPELMMPPPEMKRHLSEREIALLEKWIEDGAEWEPYWAFSNPTNPKIPEVSDTTWINNEIDHFIVDRLEVMDLEPADVVDKRRLARRLSYTLTGLPPDPKVLEDYINDESDGAYEKLVDRYLDSPRYGEHWARHWMDLVRYADTRGHEFDYTVIGAWQYRDYLIRAFNEDVPYDQMVLEQLAGDLLESPRVNGNNGFNESVIGTAFYCLTEGKHSPVDLRVDQSERIDNIIDVTSKTFQALTVACSKCHDHKFDPIPTTDYYSMYGMIESTRFTLTQAGFDNEKQLAFDSLLSNHQKVKDYVLAKLPNTSDEELSAAVNDQQEVDYQLIGDFRDGSLDGWVNDGIGFTNALGYPKLEKGKLVGLEPGKASTKILGEGLYSVLRSPGFIITEDSMVFKAAGKNSLIRVIIDNFQLIQDPIYGQLQTHIKTNDLTEYKIDLSMWKGHHAYIELLVGDYMRRKDKGFHQFDLDKEAWLEVAYVAGYSKKAPQQVAPRRAGSANPVVQAVNLKGPQNSIEVEQLNDWVSENKPSFPNLTNILEDSESWSQSLYDTSFVVGVTDGDHIESPVFIRGSLKNLSSYKVPHRFLTAISDTMEVFSPQGSGRLEFAKKIVDPENPLTARVMVNRLWHHLFGRGIVETVDNFGVQGKIPTHPELLDHLALKFVADGWSIKKMVRYMVMSQAFQRSTDASEASAFADPENVWLQHYPVRRIGAESIRDAVLATSGSLDTTMYGPSVPMYLTEFLTGRGRPRKSGSLDGEGRRSVYQAINRNFLPPMLLAFDMPIPFSTFGKRNVSNVPSQSLTMLNDPFITEQAASWAGKILEQPEDFDQRVQNIYLKAFSRLPEPEEIAKAEMFFDEQVALLNTSPEEKDMELELWKSYCHSIFNMKEFIFLI